MLYAIFAGIIVLVAVAAFVWTAIRSAVRQVTDNRRAGTATVAYWSADPDAPVNLWPTYTDPRAVDLDGDGGFVETVEIDEPMYGATAQAMRDALRRDPRRIGRGYDEINTATGGRTWDELNNL